MDYELLKSRMAKFFSETSVDDLKSKFQELGYEFSEIPPQNINLDETNNRL